MKYPTSIRIRGHEYQIEYVEYPREVDEDFEAENYLGTVSADTIRVLSGQPFLDLLETLIHEILHAIMLRNKLFKTTLKNGVEENFVTALAAEIALILLDNGLVKEPARVPPITTRIKPEAR